MTLRRITIAFLLVFAVTQTYASPKFLTLPFSERCAIDNGWFYTSDQTIQHGIDYATGYGKPLYAAADGWAIWAVESAGYGTFVLIKHDQTDDDGATLLTIYAHLSGVANEIPQKERHDLNYTSWARVSRGQLIGWTGRTGNCIPPTYAHLHFGLYRDRYAGPQIDPYDLRALKYIYPDGGGSSLGANHYWLLNTEGKPALPVPGDPNLDGPADGGIYRLGSDITLYARDSNTVPQQTHIWVDDGPDWGWGNYQSQPFGKPGGRSYTWHAQKRVGDLLSNIVTRTFRINCPPAIPSPGSPKNGAILANSTVTLSWSDPGDPDNWPNGFRDYRVHIKKSDGSWDYDSGWATYKPTSMQVTVPSDGTYSWQVAAGDGCNDAGFGPSAGFVVDTVAPQIGATGPTASVWISTKDSLTWNITDATSGVTVSTMQIDGGEATNIPAADSTQIGEGKHSFVLSAVDAAGNTASQSFGPYWVDLTAPSVTAAYNRAAPDGENGWYVSTPYLSVMADDTQGDNGSGVRAAYYSIDGGSESEYTQPVLIDTDGTHNISLRAVDNAGHSATSSSTVKVDLSAPNPPVLTVPASSGSLSILAAAWKSEDAQSAIGEYAYAVGTTEGGNDIKAQMSTGTMPFAYVPNLLLQDGSHYYITVWAKNMAGLWSTASSSAILARRSQNGDVVACMNAGGISSGISPDGVRESTYYQIVDSIGQFITGISSNGNYGVEHGFWHSDPNATGFLSLLDYMGDITTVPITVELRNQNGATSTRVVHLSDDGSFVVGNVPAGTYDIAFKASHWLQAVVKDVVVGGDVSGFDVTLVNGDINGDNQVGTADLGAVRKAYGSTTGSATWNASADLNGDGQVSSADLLIIRKNYGKIGDQ